ncbi:hypothetical protein [Ktedonobacter racemifer]|uniref:Uncharacterized protein n=1 Tax=Ktedonobacter racemifer DSM 44963 TaxID=485913 RepID=D6TT24_KTERA|nr:hypothetical protein [Ktedonobacter racemifer]EFH83575.1 hypothetical protein Krac_4562 [Ktedonobacter racemifer DSM 44963]
MTQHQFILVHEKEKKENTIDTRTTPVPGPFPPSLPGIPLHNLLEDIGEVVKHVDDLLEDVEQCRSALLGLGCWAISADDTDAVQPLFAHVSSAQEALPRLDTLIREGICQPMQQELRFFEAYCTQHIGQPTSRALQVLNDEEC